MIKKIKTKLNAFELYSIFKEDNHNFILDSSLNSNLGQYSFISANPFKILKYKNSVENPLNDLHRELLKYQITNYSSLPFVGGAVGFLSYDLVHYWMDLPRSSIDDMNVPDLYFGLYNWVIVIDHIHNETFIASPDLDRKKEKRVIDSVVKRIYETEQNFDFNLCIRNKVSPVKIYSNFTKLEYTKTIEMVRNYIKAGDIYQANLTQRFKAQTPRSTYELYKELREISPAPFGALLNFNNIHILSNSPERFVRVRNSIIETRPIKGTRPRGETLAEDEMFKKELLNSEKDKAELLMIVDLERNDIGRVSKIGTVAVPQLYKLEKYSNVYHLVAEITGQIKQNKNLVDIIQSVFPGGSITGAPKKRVMEIIDELEPTQRNVYTGSIGYIGFDGSMDLNIAIRTIIKIKDNIYFQVGGGITWDSKAEEEYQETLDKARSIMNTLRGYYAEKSII